MSRRKSSATKPTPKLYTLTQRQAQWLTEARDTEGGAYVGWTAGSEPGELVEAGAATFREVRHTSATTRSAHDPRPCEWADLYLVPTALGVELLARTRR